MNNHQNGTSDNDSPANTRKRKDSTAPPKRKKVKAKKDKLKLTHSISNQPPSTSPVPQLKPKKERSLSDSQRILTDTATNADQISKYINTVLKVGNKGKHARTPTVPENADLDEKMRIAAAHIDQQKIKNREKMAGDIHSGHYKRKKHRKKSYKRPKLDDQATTDEINEYLQRIPDTNIEVTLLSRHYQEPGCFSKLCANIENFIKKHKKAIIAYFILLVLLMAFFVATFGMGVLPSIPFFMQSLLGMEIGWKFTAACAGIFWTAYTMLYTGVKLTGDFIYWCCCCCFCGRKDDSSDNSNHQSTHVHNIIAGNHDKLKSPESSDEIQLNLENYTSTDTTITNSTLDSNTTNQYIHKKLKIPPIKTDSNSDNDSDQTSKTKQNKEAFMDDSDSDTEQILESLDSHNHNDDITECDQLVGTTMGRNNAISSTIDHPGDSYYPQ